MKKSFREECVELAELNAPYVVGSAALGGLTGVAQGSVFTGVLVTAIMLFPVAFFSLFLIAALWFDSRKRERAAQLEQAMRVFSGEPENRSGR